MATIGPKSLFQTFVSYEHDKNLVMDSLSMDEYKRQIEINPLLASFGSSLKDRILTLNHAFLFSSIPGFFSYQEVCEIDKTRETHLLRAVANRDDSHTTLKKVNAIGIVKLKNSDPIHFIMMSADSCYAKDLILKACRYFKICEFDKQTLLTLFSKSVKNENIELFDLCVQKLGKTSPKEVLSFLPDDLKEKALVLTVKHEEVFQRFSPFFSRHRFSAEYAIKGLLKAIENKSVAIDWFWDCQNIANGDQASLIRILTIFSGWKNEEFFFNILQFIKGNLSEELSSEDKEVIGQNAIEHFNHYIFDWMLQSGFFDDVELTGECLDAACSSQNMYAFEKLFRPEIVQQIEQGLLSNAFYNACIFPAEQAEGQFNIRAITLFTNTWKESNDTALIFNEHVTELYSLAKAKKNKEVIQLLKPLMEFLSIPQS